MLLVDAERLYEMTNNPNEGFETVYGKMNSSSREELRTFLIYLDKVLNYLLAREVDGIRCSQVHLPQLSVEREQAVLEFITVRIFYRSLVHDVQIDDHVEVKLRQLERKLERNVAPADARAAKGGNASYRKWQEEKQRWGEEVSFLDGIAGMEKSLWPDTILNIPTRYLHILKESWYAVTIDDLRAGNKRAYCLLNDELSLTDLLKKLIELDRLGPVRQVILFDCEWKRDFMAYTRDALTRCMARMPMKDLVMLSFERRPFRLSSLINRMQGIYRNYFGTVERRVHFPNSYVIQEEEAERLLTGRDAALVVEWVGQESELLDDYLELVSELGDEELGRLSILNIFAGAMNWDIARLLVKDLLNQEAVKGLQQQGRERFESAMVGILDVVVKGWEDIPAVMKACVKQRSVGIVVASSLKELSVFRRELKGILANMKVNFYTWRDIRNGKCKDPLIFILAYRDSGRYPFGLYPSLFERGEDRVSTYQPLLLRALFENRYHRCQYNYYLQLNELLQNEYRYKYLDWKVVDGQVKAMKPMLMEDIVPEEDDNDELSEGADLLRLDFADESHASYAPSRLLVVRSEGAERLGVLRADELPEDVESWLVQPLDELYQEMNPFNIRQAEEEQLASINRGYGVTDKDVVLWKVLLVRRLADGQDSHQLYEWLTEVFGQKAFVKYGYFKDYWLNVHSKLLTPRKRRHFKLLCEHLKIEGAYYRLMLKKRASLRANSRESRARMNALLGQMIAEGLFEPGVKLDDRPLEHLLEAHELEEVGITEENLNSELEALVAMLRENIQLKQLKKLKR